MTNKTDDNEGSAALLCSTDVPDDEQRQRDNERREGYRDAAEDLETMLSCPVCHALRYLESTEPAVGYMAGWRLAMIETKHGVKHTCPEFYQRKDADVSCPKNASDNWRTP